jgi:aryl-phospho-beta-D-glucosidase BglC (GH1 family)
MQIFKCHFMKGLARVLILLTLLHSGCRKSDEKPLNFTPIDLDIFSRDMKGFNLLGKFDVNFSNYGYTEEEFIIIRDLGFNFARIPLDYRTYTLAGNWDVFLEDEIAKIDKVIEWGKKYGVHVCLIYFL